MNFSGIPYVLFLTVAWIAAAARPKAAWRNFALLVCSYGFYATWNPRFTLLLAAASLFNHLWAKTLRRRGTPLILWIGLGFNLALLASLKYLPALLAQAGQPWSIVAPVGVSFYTFQAISYLLDVYRGFEEQPSWVEFFLYMAFWPTILSGPICRVPEMLPQYRRSGRASYDDVSTGFGRIVMGLAMKVVVADTLLGGLQDGRGVAAGFDLEGGWNTLDVLVLCIGYGLQIFFDFAGYSHVAIGSARLFGLTLRENFDSPYLSLTISDFWNRWHMSLSSWIRDYLFFPLATAGSRVAWRIAALVISMTLFGIWHGAGATYALWGLYHGLLLAIHRLIQVGRRTPQRPERLQRKRHASNLLAWSLTFGAVTLGWILFRSNSLAQAAAMATALLNFGGASLLSAELYRLVAVAAAAYFFFSVATRWLQPLLDRPAVQRMGWYVAPVWNAVLILLVIIWSDSASPFVYVRF